MEENFDKNTKPEYPNDRIPTEEEYAKKYSNNEFRQMGPVFTAYIYAEAIKRVNGSLEPAPILTKLHEVFGHDDKQRDIADDAYMAHR